MVPPGRWVSVGSLLTAAEPNNPSVINEPAVTQPDASNKFHECGNLNVQYRNFFMKSKKSFLINVN